MPSESSKEIRVDEILRPGQPEPGVGEAMFTHTAGGKTVESDIARFLAKWLDNVLRVPGTDFKIGLDPILSLMPGVGSTIASGGGVIILLEAVRSGVSMPVLLRMGGNMLVNTFFDFIPALGPVASAFFKSNSRNLGLLQKWQMGHQEAVRRSTGRLFVALGIIVLLLAMMIVAVFFGYVYMLRTVFGVGA
ncbi:MAG: DUF4112 domain-containing protein [Verrucomicrobiota bacterium]